MLLNRAQESGFMSEGCSVLFYDILIIVRSGGVNSEKYNAFLFIVFNIVKCHTKVFVSDNYLLSLVRSY